MGLLLLELETSLHTQDPRIVDHGVLVVVRTSVLAQGNQ